MDQFQAYLIKKDSEQNVRGQIQSVNKDQLTQGDVWIKVQYSSVNYKDALAGLGKGKILRNFPLIGGIDLAGTVEDSDHPDFKPGDPVIMTGSGLSELYHGGYSPIQRVHSEMLIPLPAGLSLLDAMILGTAGFTAALSLYRLEMVGIHPQSGPVLVTGASGGVGMLAINLLHSAGYEVHALTGKTQHYEFLQSIGASQCLSRHEIDWGFKDMERGIWQAAIDNCGGSTLAGLLKHIKAWGAVASCGLAENNVFQSTVMPFIIRGVSLLGINSSATPRDLRAEIWARLANQWQPKQLNTIHQGSIAMHGLENQFKKMLKGDSFGRTTVDLSLTD